MKKMTLADKLAKKAFESAAIQKSWQGHLQAFGPIMESAFVDDYQTKTHLCAALNFISNRDFEKGLKKLQPLQEKCETDADKAAWLFCMGLVFDMAGVTETMVELYQKAAQYGHRFYLPYLKVAKAAHMDAAFDVAAENYELAIDCLRHGDYNDQTRVMLGAACSNYASALTMMHRFEDAHAMLDASMDFMPVLPGRSGTHAVLFAAEGNWEVVDAAMAALEAESAELYAQTKKTVDAIREGTQPQFFTREIAAEDVAAFWSWFAENEGTIARCLAEERYDGAFAMVQPKLKELFSFMERELDLAFQPTEEGVNVIFADYYAVALQDGYEQLIAAKPDTLENPWIFVIEH